MTHLKTVAFPIALAALLSAQPLATAGDVEKKTEQTAQDLKEIKEGLKNIQEQLKSVEGLRKDVEGLKNSVQSINIALELTTQSLKARTTELAETQALLKQVRDDLEKTKAQAGKMQDQLAAQTARCDGLTDTLTQVNRKLADMGRQAARLVEGTGTIRLFNTYPEPVTVVVNSKPYRLDPNATVELAAQPLGQFSYEVPGVKPPTTVTLTADRPFDIEVFNPEVGPIKTPRR
jgi:septal ring factor EnvC (AmiA/AmiB activator)